MTRPAEANTAPASLAPAEVIADLEARYAADVRAAAEHLAERLTVAGLDDAEVLETDGHPLVSAAWRRAPDAPTVLVYGHYDVQPPEPLARWTTPPFEPSVRDGRIYARGVSDDKAPLSIAIDVEFFRLARFAEGRTAWADLLARLPGELARG